MTIVGSNTCADTLRSITSSVVIACLPTTASVLTTCSDWPIHWLAPSMTESPTSIAGEANAARRAMRTGETQMLW